MGTGDFQFENWRRKCYQYPSNSSHKKPGQNSSIFLHMMEYCKCNALMHRGMHCCYWHLGEKQPSAVALTEVRETKHCFASYCTQICENGEMVLNLIIIIKKVGKRQHIWKSWHWCIRNNLMSCLSYWTRGEWETQTRNNKIVGLDVATFVGWVVPSDVELDLESNFTSDFGSDDMSE